MYKSTEELREAYNNGERLEYVFFWKSRKQLDKGCLCQWYRCSFFVGGEKYFTAEQYMMASKARLFGDFETYKKIMEAETPKEYLALGRTVKNFDEKIWNMHKKRIVTEGNMAKFSQNEELKEYILSTEGKILVEASPYDKIWGISVGEEEKDIITNPNNWKGENLLGFSLMVVRETLRKN